MARRGKHGPDQVRVAAAGIGGCAERCAMDGRDTEANVQAEIVEILAGLPQDQRQRALDEAAASYVDSARYRHAEVADLLARAGADLGHARQIRAERRGGSFVVRDGRSQPDPG